MTPSIAAQMRLLFERQASAIRRRPALGRSTARARARLSDVLACDVEHGDGTLRADQPFSEGGSATGPHPEGLMCASLAACVAMGYRLWAARLDVTLDAVEVEVTCESDARGRMDLDPGTAVGWQRILVDATITSAADDEAVRRVVATADRLSPLLANLSPAIQRAHRLTIVRTPAPRP